MDLSKTENIAIIRRNGFGDLLCTMPLVNFCKKQNPDTKVTLFIEKRNAPLVPFLQNVDKFITLPTGNKYLSLLSTAWITRHEKFDLALSAKTSPMKMMNLFLFALRAKNRIAVTDSSWHSMFVNKKLTYNEELYRQRHQALKCLNLVLPEAKEVDPSLFPRITPSPEMLNKHEEAIQRRIFPLKSHGLPIILVSVSNNRESGRLGVDGYCSILNPLSRKKRFHVVVSCEPKDLAIAQELAYKLESPAIVVETISFNEFIVLINSIDLAFIGHGGIMHMAAALDIPQVTLFGHTLLTEWRPLSEKAICFYHPGHVNAIPRSTVIRALIEQLNSLKNPV